LAFKDWVEWLNFLGGSKKEIEVESGFFEPKTKRYIIWLIYEELLDRYTPDIPNKEKQAIFDDVYKKLREEIRKLGESENKTDREIFDEILEKRGPELTKELYRLMDVTWSKVKSEYEKREMVRRETLAKKKVIKINPTHYRCPVEGCNGSIEEHIYEDHSKAYVCRNHPDYHIWSLEDIKKGAEKYAKKMVTEGIKPPEKAEKIAEIEAAFKGAAGYPDITRIKNWHSLGIEEKKAYVSQFLKHPALHEQIKKLRKEKSRIWKGRIPFPWWARKSYYDEAEELTGFEDRKREVKLEMGFERDKLRKKYGPFWWVRPKYYDERNIKNGELRDKYFMGGGFGPEEETFLRGRLIGGINRITGRHSEHVRGVLPFVTILGLGAVISIILGSLMFFFAFFSLALQQLMPPAKQKLNAKGEKTGEWENLGTAYLRSVFKCTAIVLFALGIGQTNLPFANIFLMIVALGGYAAMNITYKENRPDQLVESFIRFGFLGVLVIPWFIFGQIFGSPLLGIMAFLFFAIPPIRVGGEAEKIERSMAAQIWKPIFMVGMLFVLMMSGVLGFNIFGGGGAWAGWELTGTLSYIFIYVWVVAFLAGIFSSPESLPAMGAIILIVTTVLFGLGPGSQNVGIALFGQWWPTVHNTVSEFTKPLGNIFSQLSQTFGQTLFMLTNPMGFARQITEGTYVENPTGLTGAYGLEIDNFDVDNIYVGEPFSIRFELSNKGSFDARNVFVEIWSSTDKFTIKDHTSTSDEAGVIELKEYEKPEKVNYVNWYKYLYPGAYETPPKPLLGKIRKQDIKPIFLLANMSCEGQKEVMKKLGITTAAGANLRDKYISFQTRLKYEYDVYSNLQIEIISQQEWDSRTRSGLLQRGQKLSRISTAPAKLSIGSMDQPIREDLPMFIGFNLSSAEGRHSKLGKAKVTLAIPKAFKDKNPTMTCTEKRNAYKERTEGDSWIITWELEDDEPKSVFCYMKAPDIGDAPSKTFTVSANATYVFERWESKDTLINFRDSCERGETENVGSTSTEEGTVGTQAVDPAAPGGRNFCENRRKTNGNGNKCLLGMGGCKSDVDCCRENQECIGHETHGFGLYDEEAKSRLSCVSGVNNGVCCFGSDINKCQAAYDEWIRQINEEGLDPKHIPNGDKIHDAYSAG